MSAFVTVYNCSNQMIPIMLSPPNGDFYYHSQCIYLPTKGRSQIPKSYINSDQLKTLQSKGCIQILHDSEKMQIK